MAAATQSRSIMGTSLKSKSFAFKAGVKAPIARTVLVVEANRRVQKKTKVIVTGDIPNVGAVGELKTVKTGYFRNWLLPQGLAATATPAILQQIRLEKEKEVQAKLELKAKAQAFADTLAAMGNVVIKKKAGDKDKIFGSVSVAEVLEVVSNLTGRKLPAKDVTLPDIKALGNYEVSVKLHPEVTGVFTVTVMKEKDIKITIQGDKKAARR